MGKKRIVFVTVPHRGFGCSDFVKTDGQTAWDVRNPLNRWAVTS